MRPSANFGNDILDLRDVLDYQRELLRGKTEDVEHWDWEDREYLTLVADLEDQLFTSLAEYARNEPIFVRDTYFMEYTQSFAMDVAGVTGTEDWPFNRIDWEAAADDLKEGYEEFQIGDFTYYGRVY